jgi:hypothetical protein
MQKELILKKIDDSVIIDRIFLLRGQKIMLDKDLAEMYGVETKRLKEAVRRNITRFPEDFMFEFTGAEFKDLRSQFATSSWGWTKIQANGVFGAGRCDALQRSSFENRHPGEHPDHPCLYPDPPVFV